MPSVYESPVAAVHSMVASGLLRSSRDPPCQVMPEELVRQREQLSSRSPGANLQLAGGENHTSPPIPGASGRERTSWSRASRRSGRLSATGSRRSPLFRAADPRSFGEYQVGLLIQQFRSTVERPGEQLIASSEPEVTTPVGRSSTFHVGGRPNRRVRARSNQSSGRELAESSSSRSSS